MPRGRPKLARSGKGRPQDADRHVGTRIRQRRIMLGLTQHQMAELIGVTYQQAHKYEIGTNRISAGRLFEIAQALHVDVAYLFEGIGQEPDEALGKQRLLLDLARNFSAISDPKHRQALLVLIRTMASNGDSE